MVSINSKVIRARRSPCFCCTLTVLAFAALLAGCTAKSSSRADARRYRLAGKIVSVDTAQGILLVDHQAIPGFMDAMTMPYPVPDAALAALAPGDEITADLVVTPSSGHLENIVVTKKALPGAGHAAARMHEPEPGDRVPDFTVINQDGKRIRLSAFRGHVLLLTFIYTRCPFPNYCPLMSKNFAQIYAAARAQPTLQREIRLLSVSFDPAHDTPAALRAYAATFSQITGSSPFDRWELAAAPPDELKDMANFFGLYYNAENGLITHSLSTAVISPDGVISKWYGDSDWTPAQLIADAAQAWKSQATAATSSHAAAVAAPN